MVKRGFVSEAVAAYDKARHTKTDIDHEDDEEIRDESGDFESGYHKAYGSRIDEVG